MAEVSQTSGSYKHLEASVFTWLALSKGGLDSWDSQAEPLCRAYLGARASPCTAAGFQKGDSAE